jgi:ATP-dependent Clp protease ATP-binding subunit ClpA
MFERFNNQARRTVVLAQEEARAFNHNYIGTEHLLLGLLSEGAGAGAKTLASVNVTLDAARQELETITGRGQQPATGHIPFTTRAKASLELSLRECLELGDTYIGTGHLLLGMIRQGDNVATQILGKLGADPKDLRERLIQELRDHPERTDGVVAVPAPERQRGEQQQRKQIQGLLDTIDARLSAIEGHLGISRAVPDELRSLEERIAEVRRDKEAAIDTQDFDRAAALRDTEKKLLTERARVERKIQAGGGSGAEADHGSETGESPGKSEGAETGEVFETAEGVRQPDELIRLRARLARLEAQLREHDIDPDEPDDSPAEDPPAAAG